MKQAKLENVSARPDLPNRFNFLDKKVHINDNSIDVYFKDKIILHLNKNCKKIETISFFGKEKFDFADIQFLFLEYSEGEISSLAQMFSFSSDFNKNVWMNSINAMLKNGKQVKLFGAQLSESNLEHDINSHIPFRYDESVYFESGMKIIRLFSEFTNKNFLILNNKL